MSARKVLPGMRWEATGMGGRSEPGLDTIRKLAQVLGVNPGLLAFGYDHTQIPIEEGQERPVRRSARKQKRG